MSQIKLKMAYLIWLLRGVPEYTSFMFEEYARWKGEGKRGCMEFQFDRWEQLFEAIRVIEAQTVYDEVPFTGMPGSPSYAGSIPGQGDKLIKLPMRKVKVEQEGAFAKAVDEHMHFTMNENRPNLQRALDIAEKNDNIFVVSVTVELEGTYSTHLYDFYYKTLSWYPE